MGIEGDVVSVETMRSAIIFAVDSEKKQNMRIRVDIPNIDTMPELDYHKIDWVQGTSHFSPGGTSTLLNLYVDGEPVSVIANNTRGGVSVPGGYRLFPGNDSGELSSSDESLPPRRKYVHGLLRREGEVITVRTLDATQYVQNGEEWEFILLSASILMEEEKKNGSSPGAADTGKIVQEEPQFMADWVAYKTRFFTYQK